MFSQEETAKLLSNKQIINDLITYCHYLSDRYNETLEGTYRIKYNALYSLLFSPVSDSKKSELLNSFATSLNINPIKDMTENNIIFENI